MLKNGEIEIVMGAFENPALQRNLPYTGGNIEGKEPRNEWRNKNFYSNGALNAQFLAFLAGYSAGKAMG
jgi:hypothetical protein